MEACGIRHLRQNRNRLWKVLLLLCASLFLLLLPVLLLLLICAGPDPDPDTTSPRAIWAAKLVDVTSRTVALETPISMS